MQDLKDIQAKIETAQKELQETTHLYSQQLEKDKQTQDEETCKTNLSRNLLTVMASTGLHASAEQAKEFAAKLGENASRQRNVKNYKCRQAWTMWCKTFNAD